MAQRALERYPNKINILEASLNRFIETDKPSAFKLFKENVKKFNGFKWLRMVDCLSDEPCFKDILSMVFENDSIYSDEVRSRLAYKYLEWVFQKKSLIEARKAYNELIENSVCYEGLYKAIINIEMNQTNVDVTMIRQHFIMACMLYGKTDFDLWTMRANFELRYGSNVTLFSVCFWAAKILNDENVKSFKLFKID